MKSLASLLAPLIKNLDLEDGARLSAIKKNWPQIFQPPLSLHMFPSAFSNGELLINVDSPVWMQELNFFKNDLVGKLSVYGVKAVRFRLGSVSAGIAARRPKSGSEKKPSRKLSAIEVSYIENTVCNISEDELRNKIKAAIEKAVLSGKTKIN